MSGFKEVLFISDENDPASSVDCYDLQLGTKIGMYASGHGVVRGSLQILGEELFLSAEVSKPPLRGSSNIHIWSIDTRNQIKRMTLPGEVTALAASQDDFYCAAGINNKIHIWNIASGQLLNVVSYHHEPITKIIFWNSTYLVSAGDDGLVAVWRLVDLITKETGDCFGPRGSRCAEPFFSSSKHSLPITDMFLAPGGNTCRIFTVSADQNCHVFSVGVSGGKFLLALTYDFILTSVLCDHLQRVLFVGTSCGKVILFPMEQNNGVNMQHVGDENSLVGHSAAVKALSINLEDDLLATGSDDRRVIIWNLTNRQQIHTCDMHGSVSNLHFHVVKVDFLTPGIYQKTIVSNFDKLLLCESDNTEVKICTKTEITYDDEISTLEDLFLFHRGSEENFIPVQEPRAAREPPELELRDASSSDSDIEMVPCPQFHDDPLSADYKKLVKLKREVAELKAMNRRLKRVNKKLYIFGLEQVWQQRNVRETSS